MKNLFKITLVITFILGNSLFSNSQSVTTIDYANSGLADSCNLFAFPKVFQGYSHRTSFGFPYFQVNEGSIALQSKPINTTNKAATQYAIRYPFKQGFTYQVRLYGKSGPIGSGSLLPLAG